MLINNDIGSMKQFYMQDDVSNSDFMEGEIMELQDYEIDIKKIKPKNVKKSDKYSKEIYRYLKDNPHYRRVWFDEASYDYEADKPIRKNFDANNMDLANLYFGLPDRNDSICITGRCARDLMLGRSKLGESYYYLGYKHSHFVEVTKEFYEKYIEIGRCISGHLGYLSNTDERYTYLDDTHRKCNWCGKEQHEETIVYTRESKKWVND